MAISDYQIQDLINKTNIIYNVVGNNLNTPISNVLANVINGNNAIQTRLTQSQNQATALTSYSINSIGQNIDYTRNDIYKNIIGSTTRISNDIQNRIGAVSQDIQKKIDSSNVIIGTKLDAVNNDLKIKITSILNPILQEVTKSTATITGNLTNAIITAETDIKQATITTNNLIGNTKQIILDKLATAATTTTTSGGNATIPPIATGGIFGGNEPSWLTNILEGFYTQQNNKPPKPTDNLATFLIRLISGNATADTFNALNAANPLEELITQVTKIGGIETDLVNGKYKTVDDFNNALKNAGIGSTILGAAIQLPIIIANIGYFVKALGLPSITKLEQLLTASYSLKQLDESDLILAYIRNNMSPDDVHKNLDNLGHSSDDSNLMMKNALPKYSVQELFRLGYLGKMAGEDVIRHMRELGWNEIDAIRHGYLTQPRPGIQDLIQFAVKEVYSPETYNKFGQYLEFPKDFSEQAKLLGLDENFARQYWAAHWQLPSAGMGYDMFHRGIINETDLKSLLKALDVMPYWRDKLIGLSYNIVARVDTRRLYAYGIWDAKKVYENYLHEGYSPQDAQSLTQFTIKYDDEQDNKHKTALQKKAHDVHIKAFNYGLQSKATAKQNIIALGYKEKDVELELTLEAYEEYVNSHKPKKENHVSKLISISLDGYRKRSIGRKDLLDTLTSNGYTLSDANIEADFVDKEANIIFKETVVKEIQKLYFESLYDDNMVLTKLVSLGFDNAEALRIIGELQILKSLDDKKPSPAQFKTMYEDGIINQAQYTTVLKDMGYNDKFIPQLIALSDGKAK